MEKENISNLLNQELLKVKGKTFSKHGRDIVVDFKISNSHDGIDIIFENNPDWWDIYWYMKFDGGMENVKELNKELNKIESFPKGYYHIIGSSRYPDTTWSKPNGAVITIMV